MIAIVCAIDGLQKATAQNIQNPSILPPRQTGASSTRSNPTNKNQVFCLTLECFGSTRLFFPERGMSHVSRWEIEADTASVSSVYDAIPLWKLGFHFGILA
jgi:hypothetical protein